MYEGGNKRMKEKSRSEDAKGVFYIFLKARQGRQD